MHTDGIHVRAFVALVLMCGSIALAQQSECPVGKLAEGGRNSKNRGQYTMYHASQPGNKGDTYYYEVTSPGWIQVTRPDGTVVKFRGKLARVPSSRNTYLWSDLRDYFHGANVPFEKIGWGEPEVSGPSPRRPVVEEVAAEEPEVSVEEVPSRPTLPFTAYDRWVWDTVTNPRAAGPEPRRP